MKFKPFQKSFEVYLKVSGVDKQILFSGRGWKGRLIQTVFLSYMGSRFNQGMDDITVCFKRIQKDIQELGVKVCLKTIKREISKLRKKEFSVKKQGYCFRNKKGKTYKGEFTILKLTIVGINKLKEISNGFFSGIKKIIEPIKLSYEQIKEKVLEEARKRQNEGNIRWQEQQKRIHQLL